MRFYKLTKSNRLVEYHRCDYCGVYYAIHSKTSHLRTKKHINRTLLKKNIIFFDKEITLDFRI